MAIILKDFLTHCWNRSHVKGWSSWTWLFNRCFRDVLPNSTINNLRFHRWWQLSVISNQNQMLYPGAKNLGPSLESRLEKNACQMRKTMPFTGWKIKHVKTKTTIRNIPKDFWRFTYKVEKSFIFLGGESFLGFKTVKLFVFFSILCQGTAKIWGSRTSAASSTMT